MLMRSSIFCCGPSTNPRSPLPERATTGTTQFRIARKLSKGARICALPLLLRYRPAALRLMNARMSHMGFDASRRPGLYIQSSRGITRDSDINQRTDRLRTSGCTSDMVKVHPQIAPHTIYERD